MDFMDYLAVLAEALILALIPFVGTLIPTLLISRLALWALRKWSGGYSRLLVAHAISLAACTVIAGFGMADGGPFVAGRAFATYMLPQAVWLGFDAWRYWRKRPEVIAPAKLVN